MCIVALRWLLRILRVCMGLRMRRRLLRGGCPARIDRAAIGVGFRPLLALTVPLCHPV